MSLKLIERWEDNEAEITNSIYLLGNVKLVHSLNPVTKDANFSIVTRSGSGYEDLEKVTPGSAHFLEHMLFNPNNRHKTAKAISRFENGTRAHPEIYINGGTDRISMYLYGGGNESGLNRVITRLTDVVNYPVDRFLKEIEKERKIIISERMTMQKKEKDVWANFLKFVMDGDLTSFVNNVVGEVTDLNNITVDDLIKFKASRITAENCVIGVQTNGELTEETILQIANLTKSLPANDVLSFKRSVPRNRLRYRSFYQDNEEGASITFSFFRERTDKIDYQNRVLTYLFVRMVRKFTDEILREKQGVIYGTEYVSNTLSPFTIAEGFRLSTSPDNLERCIKSVFKMLDQDLLGYLDKKEGIEGFESIISAYIFPRTRDFDPEYAEGLASTVLTGSEIFRYEKAQEVAKSLKIDDLKKFIQTERFSEAPHIWVVSSQDENLMNSKIEKALKGVKFDLVK